MNARLLSPSRGHGQRKKEYDADGLEATTSRAEEDLECDSEDERSNIWANIKEMTFKDLKVMFEATIGRKSAYTEKDRAKLEKSTYEILSGSLEGTPRVAHDESSSDDEEGGIGRREEEEKEIVEASMGLRFQQAVTLDDFLDGYNTQVNLPPKRVLALTSAEKSKRSSYINYWKPFARIFRDALSDFETLFGDKAGEYIGESELAMEEALVLSAGTLGQIESKQTSEQKRWKPVASAFISASAETRETMRTSWNLKGIMNQMHQEKFKAKKNSQQISEEDKKWVQKFTCPRCKTTINPKTKTAFTSKNQVTGHMTHCKKVPEQQQTRPKAAPGKSEKKRTVDMRAEEEEKEAENKKKAIRVIDDMLKKKQKSTSTQIPKRSSTLLDVVMRKEIPPVKTIVNGGPLPVIPKLTVSSTAIDPPPPRYVQQQKQTQQTQQTQQKADENKHLDDFRIEMPFGFVAPERAEPCLLIKTNARNVTERELNNLFRFFEGFQHVTVRDDTSFFGAGGEKKVIHVQFRVYNSGRKKMQRTRRAKRISSYWTLRIQSTLCSILDTSQGTHHLPPRRLGMRTRRPRPIQAPPRIILFLQRQN